MAGPAAPLTRSRTVRTTLVAGAMLLVALAAILVASHSRALKLVHHRGVRPTFTPADSGLTYETVYFGSADSVSIVTGRRLKLEGWWLVPRDGVRRRDLATVILCHSEDDSTAVATGLSGKASVLPEAAALVRAGFLVLAFDFRSYGGSEGDVTTGGALEMGDLDGAIEFAMARSLGAPVILWGRGVGATVVAEEEAFHATQVLVESPHRTWMDGILARRLPAGDGPWRWLAPDAVVRRFVAAALPGVRELEVPRGPNASARSGIPRPMVLSSAWGPDGVRSAAHAASLVRVIEAHLAALAAARDRASADSVASARADSTDRARSGVDSLHIYPPPIADPNPSLPPPYRI